MDKSPIEKAAQAVGGPAKLAALLGVTVQAVGNWKDRGIPLERCVAVEDATKGLVTRKDLRPDDWHLYWPELAESKTVSRKTKAVAR